MFLLFSFHDPEILSVLMESYSKQTENNNNDMNKFSQNQKNCMLFYFNSIKPSQNDKYHMWTRYASFTRQKCLPLYIYMYILSDPLDSLFYMVEYI